MVYGKLVLGGDLHRLCCDALVRTADPLGFYRENDLEITSEMEKQAELPAKEEGKSHEA